MTDLKRATAISKTDELYKYLNPKTAQKKAMEYLGNEAIIYKSNRQSKKYMIVNPLTKKFVHFGTMKPAMEDYTKHCPGRFSESVRIKKSCSELTVHGPTQTCESARTGHHAG